MILSITFMLFGRSLNHLIRAQQRALRDGKSKRLRCPEVDGEFELRRLLDGKISRFQLENSVDVNGGAAIHCGQVGAVRDETSGVRESPNSYRGQAVQRRLLEDRVTLVEGQRTLNHRIDEWKSNHTTPPSGASLSLEDGCFGGFGGIADRLLLAVGNPDPMAAYGPLQPVIRSES